MTGLRFGELAGLTVDRVNFIRKVLTVDRQWTADGFGPPKSSTSYRNIPLGEVAVRALADHLGTHPALEPEGIVFHAGTRPLSGKRIHEIWRRALSKEVPCPQWANERAFLGVRKPLANWLGRPVTPHDLRHFYASALIWQGADNDHRHLRAPMAGQRRTHPGFRAVAVCWPSRVVDVLVPWPAWLPPTRFAFGPGGWVESGL